MHKKINNNNLFHLLNLNVYVNSLDSMIHLITNKH